MTKLTIAVGGSRLNPTIQTKRVSWTAFTDRVLTVKRTAETYVEYMTLPVARQAAIKDVGYFIGGSFSGKTRKRKDLINRCLVTLDIDHLPPWDLDLPSVTYSQYAYALHSTHKHNSKAPRLRLILPLSRPVTPDEYELIARDTAALMGMDYFDDTTYQPARVMFWASASKDGEVITELHEGALIDVNAVLTKYEDPSDFGSWPVSSGKASCSTDTRTVNLPTP